MNAISAVFTLHLETPTLIYRTVRRQGYSFEPGFLSRYKCYLTEGQRKHFLLQLYLVLGVTQNWIAFLDETLKFWVLNIVEFWAERTSTSLLVSYLFLALKKKKRNLMLVYFGSVSSHFFFLFTTKSTNTNRKLRENDERNASGESRRQSTFPESPSRSQDATVTKARHADALGENSPLWRDQRTSSL